MSNDLAPTTPNLDEPAWQNQLSELDFKRFPGSKLTHYLFRYPAKFHPPVVAALLDQFTEPGQTVLDPFVGSGTTLVETMFARRAGIGTDVDPLAVEVAVAKTRRYDVEVVASVIEKLLDRVSACERQEKEYRRLQFRDITESQMRSAIRADDLWVPAIPRLVHWFRRYVVVDLARIWREVDELGKAEPAVAPLLRVIFASIIRNSSNADPVPVSGLEYTAHMRRRDEEGRIVNSFALLRAAAAKAIAAVQELSAALAPEGAEPQVRQGNATVVDRMVDTPVDAVLTSPPYQNAVDYYRRHQLESFWLGHVETQQQREQLIPTYIGRPNIAMKDPIFRQEWAPPSLVSSWEERIAEMAPRRAMDFRHYCISMQTFFSSLHRVVKQGAPVMLVVGHSTWRGVEIPTGSLLNELADGFDLSQTLAYPIKNRYMSYKRHNQASIDREYVLVYRRR